MAEYALAAHDCIIRTSDGALIPPDPMNADFQKFQVWKEEGNEPDPYVPPPLTELEKKALAEDLAKKGAKAKR